MVAWRQEVSKLREEMVRDAGAAVRRRVAHLGELDLAALMEVSPGLAAVMEGRKMIDLCELMCVAVACGCRVADIVRDVGGSG